MGNHLFSNSSVFGDNKDEYIVEEFVGSGAFGNVYKIKKVGRKNGESEYYLARRVI